MNAIIDFFIEGTPAPGGSKTFIPSRRKNGSLVIVYRGSKPFPMGNMVDDGKRNRAWRKTVAAAASKAFPFEPLAVALRVCMEFVLQRPKDHHVAGNRSRPLKDWARDLEPTGDLDTTKMVRSTEDSLTGIVWKDDSFVIQQFNAKRYANPGERTGCRIVITQPVSDHLPGLELFEGATS